MALFGGEQKSCAWLGNLELPLPLREWDANRCHCTKMQDAVLQNGKEGIRLRGFSSPGWGIKKE